MFAWVENNVIRDVNANPCECFVKDIADLYSVSVPDNCTAGWSLIAGAWVAPAVNGQAANPETYLHFSYDDTVTVGDTVTINITVKFADGSVAPVNSTYRVPIIRDSDGKQMEYLKAVFVAGEASVSFTAMEAGKLVMRTDKIDPMPTAGVVEQPVVFVDRN